jgi:hypothetical protein
VAPKDEPGESLLDPSEPADADAPPEEPVRQSSRKRKRKR